VCPRITTVGTALAIMTTMLLGMVVTPIHGATIVVGDDPKNFNFGWADGVCYAPIENTRVGDVLEFNFAGHNVYKIKNWDEYDRCDFSNAELLADASKQTHQYTITDDDVSRVADEEGVLGDVFFACEVGSHCLGQQRVRVQVMDNSIPREEDPVSSFAMAVTADTCDMVQRGSLDVEEVSRSSKSDCGEPELRVIDGRPWTYRSCLSPPMTLTPGGVINQATVMHFPFPTDHRVLMGPRIWEFVQGDPDEDLMGVEPVNVNQLYVHHILGSVILGNGAESIRRKDEDDAFPMPYGKLTGDFNDIMTFHIIDVRETGDQWLECVECRCKSKEGEFLGTGGSGDGGGGISCCSNCTDLTGPTVDYRLRYNVTYSEIPEDEPIVPVKMLSADIAAALNTRIEFDVPLYTKLKPNERLEDDPTIQVLKIEGTFRELFQHDFFEESYHGPDQILLHRCTGHMHIGGVRQWFEDTETGEKICSNEASYGHDADVDSGFLTNIETHNFEPPRVISVDEPIRLVTHYNASEVHTGVMGMFFLFYSEEMEVVTQDMSPLVVDVCMPNTCNASMLPSTSELVLCSNPLEEEGDDPFASFLCSFMGVCTCDQFLMQPQVTGCGGVLMAGSRFGNYSVDLFCAEACGCTFLDNEETKAKVIVQTLVETIEDKIKSLCHYYTEDCRRYLSNMVACGDELPGSEELDAYVLDFVIRDGRHMALESAKLGDEALHRFDVQNTRVEEELVSCPDGLFLEGEEMSSARGVQDGMKTACFLVIAVMLTLWANKGV